MSILRMCTSIYVCTLVFFFVGGYVHGWLIESELHRPSIKDTKLFIVIKAIIIMDIQ